MPCLTSLAGFRVFSLFTRSLGFVWNIAPALVVLTGLALSTKKPRLGFGICVAVTATDIVFYGRKLVMDPGIWPNLVVTVAAVAALSCGCFAVLSRVRTAGTY